MRSFRKRIEHEKGKTDSENSFPFLTEKKIKFPSSTAEAVPLPPKGKARLLLEIIRGGSAS